MAHKPTTEQPEPKTPAIGYRVELISASSAEAVAEALNAMGQEGWELVGLRQIGFARDLYIFKRAPGHVV